MSGNTTTFNILSLYVANVSPILEQFIEVVAQDYNLSVDELKKRYLFDNKKSFEKAMKKFKPKKKRKVHPYNVFLSDKEVSKMLCEEKNTTNQTKINPEKGELWEEYKKNKTIYEKYNSISRLENKGLLLKTHRTELLSSWDDYKTNINKILKSTTDYTLQNVVKLLELDTDDIEVINI